MHLNTLESSNLLVSLRIIIVISNLAFSNTQWRGVSKTAPDFEDLLPAMAEKLGGDGLMRELCNGFKVLMDRDKGVITAASLKSNAAMLGLQDLRDDELASMVKEGDLDGDGALNEMEFCVLMFRLSPGLMEESRLLLEEILEQELKTAGF
ncbi:calcium-binding protein PBP1-like [Hibiscus syriacus]|nr:calcium-binding protein PBP1-like [Hibiscus syriacus]